MEMDRLRSYRIFLFLLTIQLFYSTEGKTCPEKIRQHKTRCEMYYKCIELSTKKHVWLPEKCEKGLVFENKLKMCVLPADDWECTLDEVPRQTEIQTPISKFTSKHPNIVIVPKQDEESGHTSNKKDEDVDIILRSNINSDEEIEDDTQLYDSSGDGNDIDLLQVGNRESLDQIMDGHISDLDESTRLVPNYTIPPYEFDKNITSHLQRLSQLIDGLKQTYQNRDQDQAELKPDQLNAFLAHFNIRNKFDSINHDEMYGNSKQTQVVGTTLTKPLENSIKNNSSYEKRLSNKSILKPETKISLTSSFPKQYSSEGFSNSQIVVNRPEGSVLFSISPYGFIEPQTDYNHNTPKISEETLKTVLELSKQMIATQNVPKLISNPAYYSQPVVQPLFLPHPSFPGSPFSSYFNNFNNDYNNPSNNYEKPTFTNYHMPYSNNKHSQKHQSDYNNNKPGTTIIHNNVIPVHLTSTNSGEKEVVDSYGHSLGLYPPLTSAADNNNNDYTFQVTHHYENNKFVTTVRPYVTTTSNLPSAQYPPPYSTDQKMTTIAPPLQFQPTPATIAEYYTPSPYLNENNVNSIFQPSDRFSLIQYDNLPRPINSNRPDSIPNLNHQIERPPSFQNLNNNFPFPAEIDKNKVNIRPNSEKLESKEIEMSSNIQNEMSPFSNLASNKFGHKADMETHSYGHDKSSFSTYNQPSPSFTYSNHPYLPRPFQGTQNSNFASGGNKSKYPTQFNENPQLVNIGGNFISYNAFQNSILPLIGQTSLTSGTPNFEVISCQAGVRQPNQTDCTKYYVCSKKDGKVLSYSCPPYTAFNPQSRICDARSYAICSPNAIVSSYTVSENKRIQIEALQALNEANRRKLEAVNSHKIANLLQQNEPQLNFIPDYNIQLNGGNINNEIDIKNNLNPYAAQMETVPPIVNVLTPKPPKKRKYYCKEGDKIPDQTSIYSYFVCYKNSKNELKGHKMTCSKGLLFCSTTKVCTLSSKCP